MVEWTEAVLTVLAAPVNIEVLPHWADEELQGLGVRLRPYGKSFPKDIMVLGYGPTLEEALEACYDRARENRWEKLDWAARPWGGTRFGAPLPLAPPRI